MKCWKQHIVSFLFAMLAFQVMAFSHFGTFVDTVYFYDSWLQIFELNPAARIKSPRITTESSYEIKFSVVDKDGKPVTIKDHIAVEMNDSVWAINSLYLQREFKGDAKKFKDFVPLFFNQKLAYVRYSYPWQENVKEFYFYIDFERRRVSKVTPLVLKDLLSDYPDLLMRYEGMKDYESPAIVEDFFIQFIRRATYDDLRPYILDLVDE